MKTLRSGGALKALTVGTMASCLLVAVSSCGSGSEGPHGPVAPSVVDLGPPLPPPPPRLPVPPPPGPRFINVGEELKDTLIGHGDQKFYQLTALSDGTAVLRLSWDRHQGLLEAMVGNTAFRISPDSSPAIGAEIVVAAGRTYMVAVMDGAPWDYDDLRLPFVLTTSMK